MSKFRKIYEAVYKSNNLFGINKTIASNPLSQASKRANSVAIVGGVLGDEGKGRVTDEFTYEFLRNHKQVIHYRDNGGANAGHTIEIKNTKIVLHQIGSGIMQKGCTVILGKGMVLHPIDLLKEIQLVKKAANGKVPANLVIDEMATLSLDTHRAYETALKMRLGDTGSTGRGIATAYADLLYRHPLRMKDLLSRGYRQSLSDHYQRYADTIKGLGYDMSKIAVTRLKEDDQPVGNEKDFIEILTEARKILKIYTKPAYEIIQKEWNSTTPFVFEKAQAMGLDAKWGTYPDVTASDCTLEGIKSSTEGIVQPERIAIKSAVIKATYTSSVGKRRMPTEIKNKLATRIRKDANEYGATTGRPRDILYIDLPMISFLFENGKIDYLVMTHMDISYPDTPIRVCIDYKLKGKSVPYRPDLNYLEQVEPVYFDLPSWDGASLQGVSKISDLPQEALKYIAFISKALNTQILMITNGPKRHQSINWLK